VVGNSELIAKSFYEKAGPQREATFVEPMECLAVTKLPSGPEWVYEIKLDGYRALAITICPHLPMRYPSCH
jgi:ATP-dependent DNA ligase